MFGDDLIVVLDSGSRYTKAGFAGDYFPRIRIPTVVGRFRHQGVMDGFPEIFFGQEAICKRGLSNLNWPVQEGLIKDWDDIEKLWFHIFYKELHVPPEQLTILQAVHPLVSKKDREKMAEIMFETFAIRGLNLAKSPVLTLHASGRTTGLVFENGACSSYVCPVFEGFPLKHQSASCSLTGDALSEKLIEMLSKIGYSFTTPFERELINDIKAKICYVAPDYAEECQKYAASGENQIKYELPDGQHILLGEERFKVPEVLFQPSIGNLNCPSVAEYISESIKKCDFDIKSKLYENIVVSGGSTMLKGFIHRLFLDMTKRVKIPGINVAIDDLPTRQNTTWIGGSVLASLKSLKDFWMTSQEYEDVGPGRVHHKFF